MALKVAAARTVEDLLKVEAHRPRREDSFPERLSRTDENELRLCQ
jgi:hypothetical protein